MQESTENYLETIFMLSKDSKTIRSIDVANALAYSRPSVSIAMNKLRQDGYIEVSSDGFILLTKEGRNIAEAIFEKHTLILNWLISLGVDKQIALKDACKIEHIISEQSFLAIKNFIAKANPLT
ncbi:MAG: metal-dependent transcriptional regulator [Spirochaetaceae bacterium]|nr:metal-dependent transcriptional regulator [Spirochaetaceae bacterium]